MAGTRNSTRLAAADSSPKTEEKSSPRAGSKRKAEDAESPQSKRDRKAPKQQTLEETLENGTLEPTNNAEQSKTGQDSAEDTGDHPRDIEMKEAAAVGEGTDKPVGSTKYETNKQSKLDTAEGDQKFDDKKTNGHTTAENTEDGQEQDKPANDAQTKSKLPQHKSQINGDSNGQKESSEPTNEGSRSNGDHKEAVIDHANDRKGVVPSNILEKGIIYFFTRGRVGIEDPNSVQDLQRTYFVLRPIPKDGKIGDGVIQDDKVARLIAIPKKVLPKSGQDRFMVFVEKSGVSMKELKEDFFQGSEYGTKTMGVRQTPPVAPIGEGVYALTTTGGTSHLAYMLTIPKDLSEVQSDMGLREKGSFVTSLKNPTVSGPAYATLPEKPDYPEEFIKDFAGRGWMSIEKPEYLDYPNAQLLLIGQGEDKFADALEPLEKDQKHEKETPQEELEKLENEDQIRVEHMNGDDTVFADLGISKEEYPDVMTTW